MATLLGIEDQVIVALRRITRAIDLHSRDLMQQVGLTAPQLAALLAIGRLQPITVGELAKSIHLSQATLTGILTRLETRILVSRVRSVSDRRTVVVELTAEGRAVLEDTPSLLQDQFRRELLKLQEWEQTQMLATLQHIAAMMDAEEIDAAPVLATGAASATSENISQFLEVGIPVENAAFPPPDSFRDSSVSSPIPDASERDELQSNT